MAIHRMHEHDEPTILETVRIAARGDALEGTLTIPASAQGLVLFAGGGDAQSLRNRFVAEALHRTHFATLIFELMTAADERRFAVVGRAQTDSELLTRRLLHAVDWAAEHASTRPLPIGLFGAGAGAMAAMNAAAERPDIQAIVCHGGRPDLAASALEQVRAPTLFIVGGYDDQALETNRYAYARLIRARRSKFVVVFGATHSFEEPGALNDAARTAVKWFEESFAPTTAAQAS